VIARSVGCCVELGGIIALLESPGNERGFLSAVEEQHAGELVIDDLGKASSADRIALVETSPGELDPVSGHTVIDAGVNGDHPKVAKVVIVERDLCRADKVQRVPIPPIRLGDPPASVEPASALPGHAVVRPTSLTLSRGPRAGLLDLAVA
jgi:hypothetical protein